MCHTTNLSVLTAKVLVLYNLALNQFSLGIFY